MSKTPRHLAVYATLVAVIMPVTAAQAQYYVATPQPYYGATALQPAPLYPYAVQRGQPYAVEVAPNTYVIERPAAPRNYPYVGGAKVRGVAEPKAVAEPKTKRFDRPPKPADRALIEELRERSKIKKSVIHTKKIVHDEPVVIETQRVVDDPPRIIERQHIVEDEPVRAHRKRGIIETPAAEPESKRETRLDDNKKRVIQADAEVTILGPDRMSIRLFRKGQGPKANAATE